jgi:hypothetical protein
MEMKSMTQPAKKRGMPDLWTSVLVLSLSASLFLSIVGRRQDEAKRVEIAAFVAERAAFLTKAKKEIAQLEAKTRANVRWSAADRTRLALIKSKLQEYRAKGEVLCK